MDEKLKQQIIKIFIHNESKNADVTQRVLKYFSHLTPIFVDDSPFIDNKGELSSEEFDESKRMIFVTPYKGQFFKRCPGATQKKALTCCNYYVLNLGLQCNMNCSYCYLQSYLNTRIMTIYSNIEQAITEIHELAKTHSESPVRVGTGETIDSLSMDDVTLYSRDLIKVFEQYPKWFLEFKTKSAKVDQFLDLPHSKNIVVSWSINPQYIIEREEHRTASIQERFQAAKKCVEKGFTIAFHLDPMIYHTEWQMNYQNLIDDLCTQFKPEEVQVVSIGALRFQPEQRHLMRERFGMKSLVTSAEMFQSNNGKMRYDHSLRTEMYKFAVARFHHHSPQWKTFLCMETPESWIQSYQKTPMQIDPLKDFFKPLNVTLENYSR